MGVLFPPGTEAGMSRGRGNDDSRGRRGGKEDKMVDKKVEDGGEDWQGEQGRIMVGVEVVTNDDSEGC